jgi:hypothetical protein
VQSHDGGGVRRVDPVRVNMRAVLKRRGTLHPVVFSTPSPCSPTPYLLHFLIFSTSSSHSPPRRRPPPPPRLLHLFLTSTSSSSNPSPPRRTRLLVVEPVSSNPIEPTPGLVEPALMSPPAVVWRSLSRGCWSCHHWPPLAVVGLDSSSLNSYWRGWVGFTMVGLDLRLLASARCRRPTVVFDLSVVAFDLAMRPLVLLCVDGVVSSSSSSSSWCRLFFLLLFLLVLVSSLLPPPLRVVSLLFLLISPSPPSCRLPRFSRRRGCEPTFVIMILHPPPSRRVTLPSLLVVGSRYVHIPRGGEAFVRGWAVWVF